MTRREPFNALGKSAHQRRVVKKQPGKAVASMGVRARLIPLDLKRALEIVTLNASPAILPGDWKLLFQRTINPLDAERPRLREHTPSRSQTSS